MLSFHRKTASRPRHFSQPIELARFRTVGCVAADGARLKEGNTDIDLGVLVCIRMQRIQRVFLELLRRFQHPWKVVQRRFADMALGVTR